MMHYLQDLLHKVVLLLITPSNGGQPQQSVDYYLDPSEAVTGSAQNDYPDTGAGLQNPWNA